MQEHGERRAKVHDVTRASKPLAAELVARKPSFPEDCNGSFPGVAC